MKSKAEVYYFIMKAHKKHLLSVYNAKPAIDTKSPWDYKKKPSQKYSNGNSRWLNKRARLKLNMKTIFL